MYTAVTLFKKKQRTFHDHLPEVMKNVPARPDVELDSVGQDGVRNQPPQNSGGQVAGWELLAPDVDDWDEGEGGGRQGTNYIDVAGRHVQNTVP